MPRGCFFSKEKPVTPSTPVGHSFQQVHFGGVLSRIAAPFRRLCVAWRSKSGFFLVFLWAYGVTVIFLLVVSKGLCSPEQGIPVGHRQPATCQRDMQTPFFLPKASSPLGCPKMLPSFPVLPWVFLELSGFCAFFPPGLLGLLLAMSRSQRANAEEDREEPMRRR